MSQFKNAIAIVLTVTSIALGQSTGTKPAGNPVKSSTTTDTQGQVKTLDATRKQALGMLDQLLESALGFGDAEVRIRVQAQIADLLWESDQPRARALITAAFNAVPETALPPVDKEIPPSYVGADSHYPLRADLLRVIAQRDSALAVKLVETVVDQPPNVDPKFSGSGYGKYSEQAMLYGQIVGNVLIRRGRAARIARVFVGNIELDCGSRKSSDGNADVARELFTQALAAARTNRERAVSNMRSLADVVFQRFGEGVIRFTQGNRDPGSSNPRNPEFVEPFLEFAFAVIMETTRSTQASDVERVPPGHQQQTDLTVARLLLPYFEQYMPDKATILRPRIEEAVRVAAPGERGETTGRRPVDDAGDGQAAETNEGRVRMNLFRRVRAAQAGQIDQAKRLQTKSQFSDSLTVSRRPELRIKALRSGTRLSCGADTLPVNQRAFRASTADRRPRNPGSGLVG